MTVGPQQFWLGTARAGQKVTLQLADASVQELGMNPFQAFLHLLSDPNIAFILFAIGFYGLLFELMHPNFVTGILGGLALILAFIGSGSLPLNVATTSSMSLMHNASRISTMPTGPASISLPR